MTNAEINDLAFALVDRGPHAVEDGLAALARHARSRQVAQVAAGVMSDPTAPPVARERAFAVVLRELGAACAAGQRRVVPAA